MILRCILTEILHGVDDLRAVLHFVKNKGGPARCPACGNSEVRTTAEGDWDPEKAYHQLLSKTRPIYEEYRKAGYSKKFLEAHREEITIHKAAKAAFDKLGVKKLPKIKELSAEYAEVLGAKRRAYAEYRQVKNEARELLIARKNISSLYEAERKESGQDHRTTEQSR